MVHEDTFMPLRMPSAGAGNDTADRDGCFCFCGLKKPKKPKQAAPKPAGSHTFSHVEPTHAAAVARGSLDGEAGVAQRSSIDGNMSQMQMQLHALQLQAMKLQMEQLLQLQQPPSPTGGPLNLPYQFYNHPLGSRLSPLELRLQQLAAVPEEQQVAQRRFSAGDSALEYGPVRDKHPFGAWDIKRGATHVQEAHDSGSVMYTALSSSGGSEPRSWRDQDQRPPPVSTQWFNDIGGPAAASESRYAQGSPVGAGFPPPLQPHPYHTGGASPQTAECRRRRHDQSPTGGRRRRHPHNHQLSHGRRNGGRREDVLSTSPESSGMSGDHITGYFAAPKISRAVAGL